MRKAAHAGNGIMHAHKMASDHAKIHAGHGTQSSASKAAPVGKTPQGGNKY